MRDRPVFNLRTSGPLRSSYEERDRSLPGDSVGDTAFLKDRNGYLVKLAKRVGLHCDSVGGEKYTVTSIQDADGLPCIRTIARSASYDEAKNIILNFTAVK